MTFLIIYNPMRYYIVPDEFKFDKLNPNKKDLADYEVSRGKFMSQRQKMRDIAQKKRDKK